jgi:hypothetical protein
VFLRCCLLQVLPAHQLLLRLLLLLLQLPWAARQLVLQTLVTAPATGEKATQGTCAIQAS